MTSHPYHPFLKRNTWVFDLDNTLYASTNGLFPQVEKRIGDYVVRATGLTGIDARKLQKKYFMEHGTTLQGLMKFHGTDPHDYLDYVHDIDFTPVAEDKALKNALEALPGRRLVFTNADATYAEKILARLGVAHLFEDIFDIHKAKLTPKPQHQPYEDLKNIYGIIPEKAVMIEDMARNLKPAHTMGMSTLWVKTACVWGKDGYDTAHIHAETDDLPAWLTGFTKTLGES